MAQFEISYPCNPFHVNQPFGVNGAYYQAHGINIKGHNGLDLQAYHGQPIYAPCDGVAYYEVDDSQGEGVVIRTTETYPYKGQQVSFKVIMWHMVDTLKEPQYKQIIPRSGLGVPVKQGDQIGWADNTGLSTGDHCHFGLKPIIPGPAPTEGDRPDVGIGNFVNLEQSNGYLGCIDPTPYWTGFYAKDAEKVQQVVTGISWLRQAIADYIAQILK